MSVLSVPVHDPLRPQRTDGLGTGAALAVLVHALLILALTLSVNWRTAEPEAFSAELWAAVPQVAAPPLPPTPQPQPEPSTPPPVPQVAPPQPVQADIALERQREREAREKQLEAERAEKLRLARLEADRKDAERKQAEKLKAEERQKADEERLARQREENLRRMLGQVGATGAPGSTGSATRDAGPSAGYAGRIRARVKPNIVFTDEVSGNPTAEVEVRSAPDGTIVGRRLVRPSGVKDWDEAVLRALDRTEVLPKDIDGRVPATMIISFRPRD